MTRLAIIGTGYVGLTTGVCFAHLGHQVVCADIDADKVERLSRGEVPIVEHRLDELLAEGLRKDSLKFVVGAAKAVADAEIVFLCVPTPQGDDGSADLSYVEAAAAEIATALPYEAIVVNKSTVPVGSTRVVERVLKRPDVRVVSNPEFLREGSAVDDFLRPDRVIIGAEDRSAAIKVGALYDPIHAQVIVTDPASAETIKYAANAFLATKLSFVNAIAAICEGVGADVNDVVVGMGFDKRIGSEFLRPGPGWGGSCFDGKESLMVRDASGPRILQFCELPQVQLRDLEVLSWAPGQVIPEYQPVLAVTERPYDGTMVTVRTKMGRWLTVTADHPLVVRDGDDVAIIEAADLTTSHWLPISLGAPLTDGLDETTVTVPHGGTATNGTYVPAVIDMDDAWWEMIGLFLAEGHIGTDGERRRVCWSFHPTEEMHLAEFVADYWRTLGTKVTVRRLATTLQVSISSRILAALFEHVLGLGANCYEHRIPALAWQAPDSGRRALLRGLWAGDGSWSLLNGGPSVALEYGTVSGQLADGMLRLLGEQGVVARHKIGRTTRSTVDTHWLVVSGADQIEAVQWLLEPHERTTIMAHISRQTKRIAPTGYKLDRKGTAWVRVVDVTHSPTQQNVYSVEVARNHTVVTTGGLVAHNCFPKDSRALVKIAHDAGYRFELLEGVIAVNEQQFERVTDKIRVAAGGSLAGATVAVWGLTFKARTDDLRDSPAISIITRLIDEGATVKAYDPTVPAPKPGVPEGVHIADDALDATTGANVVAVLTEWDDFRWISPQDVAGRMAGRAVVDGRNLLDASAWQHAGFSYTGIGR